MKAKNLFSAILVGIGSAMACLPASAATTWSFGSTLDTSPHMASDGSGTQAVVSGYYAVNNTTKLTQDFISTAANNDLFTGGYGLCGPTAYDNSGCTSPQHALDNNLAFESLLLNFRNSANSANISTSLNSLTLGWAQHGVGGTNTTTYNGADITVLAYTGSNLNLSGTTTYQDIKNSIVNNTGWKLIGNYGNVQANTTVNLGNSTPTASYWLVAAYNSLFGACSTCDSDTAHPTATFDFVKLQTVTDGPNSSTTQVPEPSSVALLAAALLGAGTLRRRGIRSVA